MSKFADELTQIGGLKPLGGEAALTPKSEAPPVQPGTAPYAPRVVQPLPPGSPYVPPVPGGNMPPPTGALPTRPTSYPAPPEDDAEVPSRLPTYIGGGVAAVILIWIGTLFIPSAPVDAPTEWTTFTASDQSFACELPKKWEIKSEGNASTSTEAAISDGVTAKRGDADVEVSVSSVTGLIKAQLMFGDDPIPSGFAHSRATPIYQAHGRVFKKRFAHYKSKRVEPTPEMIPRMTGIVPDENNRELLPDLRWSEWTASGNQYGFGGKRHGYRTTVGGNNYIVNVVCECSERDWPKLKPAFERMIVSVSEPRKAGPGGGVAVPGGGSLPTGDMPGFGGSGL